MDRQRISYAAREAVKNPQHPIAGSTANRAMGLLRQARNLAVESLGLKVPDLTFPHFEESVKGRYIPPGDFYSILANVPQPVKVALMELAYLTGVRNWQLPSTELRNVRVDRGCVAALVWEADKVKTRQPHEVPLVGRAQQIVQEAWDARRLDCKHLFHVNGQPLGDLRSEWNRACRKAGFPIGRKAGGYVFHNTRHSCLTSDGNALFSAAHNNVGTPAALDIASLSEARQLLRTQTSPRRSAPEPSARIPRRRAREGT